MSVIRYNSQYFQLPIVLLIKNAERVISVIVGIFLIAIAVLILTPLGFPYSGDPLSPAPQRFMIAVTKLSFLVFFENFCLVKNNIAF